MDLRPLSDEVLLARLEALASQQRGCVVDLVEHLMEVDRRDITLDRAYTSLFDFCVKRLRFSESEAYLRIRAARAALEHPRILDELRSGQLTLDSVARLSSVLTRDNHDAVLSEARGVGKRQVMALVSKLGGGEQPKPDVIRPVAAASKDAAALPLQEVIPPQARMRFEFEADDDLVVAVDRLKGLLRHKYPFARLEDVFREAVAALMERLEPRSRQPRAASGREKGPAASGGRSRRIPAAVKRLVWQRDGGRCAFEAEDGRRCESRDALQYDHVTPWALGGPSDDPGNIRLLCRPHNLRLARRRFGPRPR